ncbi:MAG: hypothetical protein HQ580_19930 [Planctomycetes bacterium]|nr:hypothetical protein [Planctomycetota bacterium]
MSKDATPNNQPYATQVSSSASPLMFGADLANDLLKSITIALEAKAVFREGSEPLEIFRDAVANAITNIDERASLLRRFLRHGPYEREGDIPPELQGLRLTKQEVSKAITFIYSHAVNCFQGQLAELLAVGPFVQLTEELKASGRLPSHSRTYVGDSVLFSEGLARHRRKAADIHIVSIESGSSRKAVVHALAEVKSYACGATRLQKQIAKHVARVRNGALVSILKNKLEKSEFKTVCPENILLVGITPANWKLPRDFSFTEQDGKTLLKTDTRKPPNEHHYVNQVGPNEWRIVLRWSKEALASAAYELTFWYMEKLGEAIFREGLPSEWQEMTPAEAGRNAAKMMLYYAILHSPNRPVEQRAIALYNTYGFGYALGMNFRDSNGHREMLWPEDLREITSSGLTKHGFSIWH